MIINKNLDSSSDVKNQWYYWRISRLMHACLFLIFKSKLCFYNLSKRFWMRITQQRRSFQKQTDPEYQGTQLTPPPPTHTF